MRPTGSKTATEKSWPSRACSLYAVLWTVVPTSTAMDCRPPQMTASVMGSTRGALMNPARLSRGGWRSRPPMLPRRGGPPPLPCPPPRISRAKPALEQRRGDPRARWPVSSGRLDFHEEGGVVVDSGDAPRRQDRGRFALLDHRGSAELHPRAEAVAVVHRTVDIPPALGEVGATRPFRGIASRLGLELGQGDRGSGAEGGQLPVHDLHRLLRVGVAVARRVRLVEALAEARPLLRAPPPPGPGPAPP